MQEELDQRAEQLQDADTVKASMERLRAENEALRRENAELRAAPGGGGSSGSASCSGCRLRAVMTDSGTTQEVLARCISVVEASLGEARRELSRKELSNRRARYEQLHRAMDPSLNDEALLAEAIAAAAAANVDDEELGKARKRLEELRSMTPEERLAQENREIEAKRKKEAFLLVKKNNVDTLSAFLDDLGEAVRWQDWRDHAGRTMIRCSQELRATKAQEFLVARAEVQAAAEAAKAEDAAAAKALAHKARVEADLARARAEAISAQTSQAMSTKPPSTTSGATAPPTNLLRQVSQQRRDSVGVGFIPVVRDLLAEPVEQPGDDLDSAIDMGHFFSIMGEDEPAQPRGSIAGSARGSFAQSARGSFALEAGGSFARGSLSSARGSVDLAAVREKRHSHSKEEIASLVASDSAAFGDVATSPPEDSSSSEEEEEDDVLPPELEAKFKPQAFRAVVQDDCESLSQVLEQVNSRHWSKWENKAGKDLLTLSEERGSAKAYLILGKALDIIKETKREAYEEREAVWIFANGDVQPRRASVLEDTLAEADEILIEYWDGNDAPTHVDRCFVRKMGMS